MGKIIQGDCIEKLKEIQENSVDFLLTDPPYGINFMAKKWDKFSDSQKYQMWTEEWGREVYRVLKPGAFGLVFADTRMDHRVKSGLEDAGFEIRDTVMWVFLSGFPKGQDISKFIDKWFGLTRKRGAEKVYADGGKASDRKRIGEPLTKTVYAEKGKNLAGEGVVYETEAVSEEAKIWSGYRTGLKPAYEPVILIQKPREGTFVNNILKWGVGALNIDGCRIPINIEQESDPRAHDQSKNVKRTFEHENAAVDFFGKDGVRADHIQQLYEMKGRYPTNVIIDEMVAELMDMISGIKKAGKMILHKDVNRKDPDATWNKDNCGFKAPTEGVSNLGDGGGMSKHFKNVDKWCDPLKTVYGGEGFKRSFEHFNLKDGGGMGRFFYCPKASTRERETGLEDIETQVRDTSRKGDPANPYNRNHKVKNFHPCLAPESLVFTNKGYKQISTLNKTELVLTEDGCFNEIEYVSNHSINEYVYTIEINGSNFYSIRATDNHPFLIYTPVKKNKGIINYIICWKPASEVKEGDYILTPIINHKNNLDIGDDLYDKDFWYIIGLYLAEGSLQKAGHGDNIYPVFTLNIKETDVIDRIKLFCNKKDINFSVHPRKSSVNIHIWSDKYGKFCYYLCGKYSYEKTINPMIYGLNKELLKEFFDGYIKGDGNIIRKEIRAKTVSFDMATQLGFVANLLGYGYGCYKYEGGKQEIQGRVVNARDYYQLYFYTQNNYRPSFILYNGHKYALKRIKKVSKELYNGLVWNLTVKNSPTFQTIIGMSHNTVKPIKLLTYLVRMIRPPIKNPVMLDPFAGSGSSALAAKIEGCDYILIENNPEYIPIIEGRLAVDIKEFQDFTDNEIEPKKEQTVNDYFKSFF